MAMIPIMYEPERLLVGEDIADIMSVFSWRLMQSGGHIRAYHNLGKIRRLLYATKVAILSYRIVDTGPQNRQTFLVLLNRAVKEGREREQNSLFDACVSLRKTRLLDGNHLDLLRDNIPVEMMSRPIGLLDDLPQWKDVGSTEEQNQHEGTSLSRKALLGN